MQILIIVLEGYLNQIDFKCNQEVLTIFYKKGINDNDNIRIRYYTDIREYFNNDR